MAFLGIESSCDDLSIALVKNRVVIGLETYSQHDLCARFGGVVPELLSRLHMSQIDGAVRSFLRRFEVKLAELEGIAVTQGPGLVGSLLVGVNFAKGLALAAQLPLVAINHLQAHLFSPFLDQEADLIFPMLGVILSGGHTLLMHLESPTKATVLGSTQDDALGELLDKTAKMLNLGKWPGGAALEECAMGGNPKAFKFTFSKIRGKPFDFSFSGTKTQVRAVIMDHLEMTESCRRDIAASLQFSMFHGMTDRIIQIAKQEGYKAVCVGGGVVNNRLFCQMLQERISGSLFMAKSRYAGDNGAMVAGLGEALFAENGQGSSLDFNVCTRFEQYYGAR